MKIVRDTSGWGVFFVQKIRKYAGKQLWWQRSIIQSKRRKKGCPCDIKQSKGQPYKY